ncbi:MAG: glycosyltransferase family 2 protein [Patescibacteria group bacterium]
MKLVVLIPAFNEEHTIGRVIELIPHQIAGIDTVEVIVIDDGSTDKTAFLAREKGATVVSHATNMGVGAAFSTGVLTALKHGGDVIVNMDADLQFDPFDIPALIQPILNGIAGFVTASRFKDKSLTPKMPFFKKFGNHFVAGIINFITKQHFTDVSCGFRAMNHDTALRINLFGDFTYTQETFIDLVQKKVPVIEIPLKIRGQREHGDSRVAKNVIRYGIRSLIIMLRAMRDFKPLKFFGIIGLALIGIGFVVELFVFIHWAATGNTAPFQSLIIVGGVFVILGFLLIILALIADMMGRIRRIEEENLYFNKKQHYNHRSLR